MMRKRPVIRIAPDGTRIEYESLVEAANENGISPGYLANYIRRRSAIRGCFYRYSDRVIQSIKEKLVCPFYVERHNNTIICGGFSKCTTMNTSFENNDKCTEHMYRYCAKMSYDSCEISEAIMDILDAEEERKREKIIELLRSELND